MAGMEVSGHLGNVPANRVPPPAGRAGLQPQTVMSIINILLVVLAVMFLVSLPTWPHSRTWGLYPSGGLGAVLIVLLILVLLGRV